MGQSQPEASLTRSILSISKEIDERLQSLQSNRYLKRWDDKFHLCNSFRTWMKQAKALDPSSSGIDFLVRDSSELKGMITESLNVINNHLSLLPRPPSSDEPDRSRSRSSKRKRPRTQSPERLDPEQSTPNEGLSPRSRAWDVASVVSTALSSTESAIMLASDPLRLSQKMIERSLTWLSPMTNLSRKLTIEKRFPELCEHFDYSGNEMTFDIYPRALETVNKLAYKASHELRVKLAIAASLRVSELIRDKNMADLESNEPYHAGQRTEVEDTSNLNINWHSPAENIPAIRLSPPEPNLKGVGRHMDPTSPKPQSPAPRKDKFNSKADSQWLICIVDGCEKPFTNYNSITAWLKHLDTKHPRNRNAPTWICTDQSHGPDIQRFEELILFQNHMWKEHQDTFEPNELPELAELCKEYVAPTGIFDICPFCGYQNRYRGHSSTLKPERPQLNHIIQHFDELSAEFLKWVTEYEPSIRSVDPRERWLDPKVSQTAKGNLWVSTFSEYDGMRGYAGEAFWVA